MDPVDYKAVVAAFTRASADNDNDAIRALLAPELTLWHNFSNRVLSRERMMSFRTGLRDAARSVQMTARLTLTADGCIRENLARGTTKDGQPFEVSYLVYFQISPAGKIVRMTEYYDSAQLAPLMAAGWNPLTG